MPGSGTRSSNSGYASPNAVIKYTYSMSDPSEVTNRNAWGSAGIKGDGLGFDGGCPTSQRGGIQRKWVKGARIGGRPHTEKFVQALDNSLGADWGNATGKSSRGALGRQPTRCLTPFAVTLDESRSESHLFPRVPRKSLGSDHRVIHSQQRSLERLSPERVQPESSLTSTFELQHAEEQAAISRDRASTAAAAVRQAIWQRARQRPCQPTADELAVNGPPYTQWTTSGVVVDPLWQALANAGTEQAAKSAANREAGRQPTLRALAEEEGEGLAKILAWANCDSRLLQELAFHGVLNAEHLLHMSEMNFAEAGFRPQERRRLQALLKKLSYDSDNTDMGSIESAGYLLQLRGKRDGKNLTRGSRKGSQQKEAWRRPKKTMDHAYYEAMQLLEGDSEVLRREQVQELHTRQASAELTRGMHLALGVREVDLRRTAVIGASGKAVERLNGTVRGTAAATSPTAKSPAKRLGWESLIA
eukprot:COSAG02_NODE_453_length_22025_cov_16.179923_9_plen_474_part_00